MVGETNSDGAPIRLAMLGMIEGNGHPYSWSAIINGYEEDEIRRCPYPVIADYLGAQSPDAVGFRDARVTHIWTDTPDDAPRVARAARIERIVSRPEDVIGEVDAVIIATDDGDDHVARARPFVECNLPVFVDKPMATNREALETFSDWVAGGARILSSSGMRYSPETRALFNRRDELGDLRWISSFTAKTWERYGIHALEAVYPYLGPGFESVRLDQYARGDVAFILHRSGVSLTIPAIHDAYGSFGKIQAAGTKGALFLEMKDTFTAFRDQLRSFVDYLKTGVRPFPYDETRELMAILIAGRESRKAGGTTVKVASILD